MLPPASPRWRLQPGVEGVPSVVPRGGGYFALATAYSANIRRVACPWAPFLPSSSMAKGTSMLRSPWVSAATGLGVPTSALLELLVLHLLSYKPRHRRNLQKNDVSINIGDHSINDEVPTSFRKVQDHNIAWAGGI